MDHKWLSLTIDDQFINVAKRLKEKYKLAILSNDVSEWSKYLREKFLLDELVQFSIISGDIKCRKPDAAIYQLAIEKMGTTPENCIFIDDSEKNLLSAQKEGIKVVRFFRGGEVKLNHIPTINSFEQLEQLVQKIWGLDKNVQ